MRTDQLDSVVHEHLVWLHARGYAKYTIEARCRQLHRFIRWSEEQGIGDFRDYSRRVIEKYRIHLFESRRRDGRSLGWGSLAQPLLAIRGLFRWLSHLEVLASNPAADVALPKRGRRLPRHVLSARDMRRLLAVPDVRSPLGLRNRAILEVLYSTGIRRAECAHLRLTDLDFDRGVVLIRDGKGSRDRFVPIGRRASQWVKQYLRTARRGLRNRVDHQTLFLTRAGTPISVKRVGGIVHDTLQAADVTGGGSCHLIRHTTATLMLEGGADIRDLQEFLGHAQLSTTAIYARVSIARLQAVHRKTHPAW